MCQPGIARPLGEIWPVCPNESPSIVYCAEATAVSSSHDAALCKVVERMLEKVVEELCLIEKVVEVLSL